jgi:hypothetical protein
MSGPAAMIMHVAWSLGFWRQIAAWVASGGRPPPPEPRLSPAPAAS